MKRNEIKYVKSTFMDYFFQDNCELYNIGTFNVDDGKTKIEIFIHLYDFKHVKSYYKLNYEEKYENLVMYKKRADECFKKGTQAQIYRAMKIYHNLNYRFDEGDVFGSDKDKEEEKLKNEKKELYENLVKMRINVHNNFALCKFKLGKIYSCYEAATKTLTIDDKNPKALFLHGKSCLMLNFYKPAVDSLRKLKQLQPDNHDVDDTLNEAEKKYNNDLEKEKNMFKKMFKSSGNK
jgi:tetratricopeptide (TPR) repeat protein